MQEAGGPSSLFTRNAGNSNNFGRSILSANSVNERYQISGESSCTWDASTLSIRGLNEADLHRPLVFVELETGQPRGMSRLELCCRLAEPRPFQIPLRETGSCGPAAT